MLKKFIFFVFLVGNFTGLLPSKIVVVIPSYNNIQWYDRNLSSLLNQKGVDFEAIYIDDYSPDGTGKAVEEYLAKHDPTHRVHLVKNSARKGALANHWYAVKDLNPNTIVIHLDGDDFFAHENVLLRVQAAYADGRTAVTYGQYQEYPSGTRGHCRPLEQWRIEYNQFRSIGLPFPTSHLRTFKAGLFQNIPLVDLMYKGNFYPTAGDIAFFLPILEQAGKHIKFIPDILYIYNTATPINDFKVRLQETLTCFYEIKQKPAYIPLKNPCFFEVQANELVDVIIFSDKGPKQLYALLESIEKNIQGIGTINVIVKIKEAAFEEEYKEIKKQFPLASFINQNSRDFKSLTLKTIQGSPNNYIMFAKDDIVISDHIDLCDCTKTLRQTKVYGFFLNSDKNHMNLIDLGDKKYAWFLQESLNNNQPLNCLTMVIYKKETIMPNLTRLSFNNQSNLETAWPSLITQRDMGVCCG